MDISFINGANVYMDGNNLLGKADEVELPQLKQKMEDHAPLGLYGAKELPMGFEKMEAKIKWHCLYPDVLKKAAHPITPVALQIRGNKVTKTSQGNSETAIIVHFRGTFKELNPGTFKQHETVKCDTTLTVDYVKLVDNGEELYEIDIDANIYKVNGEDILLNYRNNLGLGAGVGENLLQNNVGAFA